MTYYYVNQCVCRMYVQCNKRPHHRHSKSAVLFAVGWRSVDLGWAKRMRSFSLSCVLGICLSVQLAFLYIRKCGASHVPVLHNNYSQFNEFRRNVVLIDS
jgi:hypothetical protein